LDHGLFFLFGLPLPLALREIVLFLSVCVRSLPAFVLCFSFLFLPEFPSFPPELKEAFFPYRIFPTFLVTIPRCRAAFKRTSAGANTEHPLYPFFPYLLTFSYPNIFFLRLHFFSFAFTLKTAPSFGQKSLFPPSPRPVFLLELNSTPFPAFSGPSPGMCCQTFLTVSTMSCFVPPLRSSNGCGVPMADVAIRLNIHSPPNSDLRL